MVRLVVVEVVTHLAGLVVLETVVMMVAMEIADIVLPQHLIVLHHLEVHVYNVEVILIVSPLHQHLFVLLDHV